MNKLKTSIHPDVEPLEDKSQFTRLATRAITIKENKILLMYTERYQDYSLPGGGVDAGEDIEAGLVRELQEETGAQNIRNVVAYGLYEEFRPWYKAEFDVVHMLSYCFTCDVDEELGAVKLEDYEIKNGMRAEWVDIDQAIAHNLNTIENSAKKGLSIERETYLLQHIRLNE
ncbi:DNA mismatch repair protein MutT [Veronia nyctiphanis]|uniref:DNA mismatch repair protein MutT n=1 Tax=Veronia nyctiphanis TaxID=1278244 RepID=A0A4Q0YVZ6_9GAMM|nr:NUDIX hydrolase [Veronia nyctiphanis]RXJ74414.1 DNA mismatch repair protein MutT [Veronia nyctiphanis]